MQRKMHKAIFGLTLAVTIGVAVAMLYPEPPPIVGTFGGDMVEVFSKIYECEPRLAVKEARTVVTFRRNGTYVSEDTALFEAVGGPRKGTQSHYRGESKGVFTWRDGVGTLRETEGERTADGRPLDLQMPDTVTLRLEDPSTLIVTEDYGDQGRYRYSLKRQ